MITMSWILVALVGFMVIGGLFYEFSKGTSMTEGEKMVWAAAYATHYMQSLEKRDVLGTPQNVRTSIENAWAAVQDMRENRQKVLDNWGNGDPILTMLDEMLRG